MDVSLSRGAKAPSLYSLATRANIDFWDPSGKSFLYEKPMTVRNLAEE